MPESVWIKLKDPKEYEGITSAVEGLDGVSTVRDLRESVEPIYGSHRRAASGRARRSRAFLVVAALLLVANTIRLAAFARRKEIGIMRLVGASTLYIALPFLLEALVTALVGVAARRRAPSLAFMYFGIEEALEDELNFMPWVGLGRVRRRRRGIAILGPLLTLIPTLVLTRKYLKV